MKKLINIGSDCSGVGSFPQAIQRLGLKYEETFSCDFDFYARQTYLLNFGTAEDIELGNSKEHKKYCDGVQKIALSSKIPSEKEVCFLEEANEYAKKFSFYYPFNMYQREIPSESNDIYMGSFPCQSFSLAGSRKGEESVKGILFYEGHRYIKTNKPRYFIIENVKGLLSDDGGKTFQKWIDYLGGKSVNGNPVIFPHEESVPYHVYYQVMNAKHYGVPQNRERIFIIGIRDDSDNDFSFPKPFHLEKRLKDVLESEVNEKYFLSDKMISGLINHQKFNKFNPTHGEKESSCITSRVHKMGNADNYIKVGFINQDTQASQVFSENGTSPNICAGTHGYANGYVEIPTNNSKGYDIAEEEEEEDSINFSNPNSETRRGRVGHKVSQTLDTACQQGIYTQQRIRRLTPREAFRLMDFNEDFIEKTLNSKKHLYFQFVYSKFDINKKETLCNVKLKTVKDTQTQKNLETYVLCTTKECQKMELLKTSKQKSVQKKEKNDKLLNVSFAIELLGEKELKECAINTIKWTDCMETLYTLMKEGKNQVVKDISEIQKDKSCIEKSLKITLEENLSEEKLFITLILLKQIMTSKIYTYVKMPLNTQKFIISTVVYEKKSEKLLLSYLKMEYTEQVVSDSMLYKQAGNSIVVNCLVEIIKKLKL